MPTEVTNPVQRRNTAASEYTAAQQPRQARVAEKAVARQNLPPGTRPAGTEKSSIKEAAIDTLKIGQALDILNKHVQNLRRDLHFSVDADSGRTIIRVIDSETRETIRTIPAEDVSGLSHRLEYHTGVLLSTSV